MFRRLSYNCQKPKSLSPAFFPVNKLWIKHLRQANNCLGAAFPLVLWSKSGAFQDALVRKQTPLWCSCLSGCNIQAPGSTLHFYPHSQTISLYQQTLHLLSGQTFVIFPPHHTLKWVAITQLNCTNFYVRKRVILTASMYTMSIHLSPVKDIINIKNLISTELCQTVGWGLEKKHFI